MKHLSIGSSALLFIFLFALFHGCETINKEKPWNKKYNFIQDLQPIVFHYDHGMLAGSYPHHQETVEIQFNDVCKYLGHVCLCGAGGYKISKLAIHHLGGSENPLERGDFIIISSRDHTVSDVIAYILGCSRRNDPDKNQYFVDPTIPALKREYHYYIGYVPERKAVHIIYRKHLLIGNDRMDSLWKVELAYEKDPDSVNQADMELYQNTMFDMVKDVLLDQKKGLIETEFIDYNEFLAMQNRLKNK